MEDRIKELELKVMYQEKLISELNEAVTELGLEREKLRRRMDKLEGQVEQLQPTDED